MELNDLGAALREHQDDVIETRERAPIDSRLERLRTERQRRRAEPANDGSTAMRRMVVPALLGAAAAAILMWFVTPTPDALVTFQVASKAGAIGQRYQADGAGRRLDFSEGSSVVLQTGASARVIGLTTHGARVRVDAGTAHTKVVHRESTEWIVGAGPFEVHVTGTEFDTTWDVDAQRLTVTMQEGSVLVTGGCLTSGQSLRAGESQSFQCPRTSAKRGDDRVDRKADGAGKSVSAAASLSNDADANAAAAKAVRARDSGASDAGVKDWRALAKKGRYKPAYQAAAGRGIDSLMATLGGGDALLLANTVRLSGHPSQARSAYLTIRNRFGGGIKAQAAFFLGRIAFDSFGQHAEARRWFQTYLQEQPGGSWAQEAHGRVMEAEYKSGGKAAARAAAERYLARYPTGAHAALAKSIVAP